MNARICLLALTLALAGCRDDAPQALGTLEWDRIALPAPASEKIVSIDVREGQRVKAGTRLLQLEVTRTQAQLDALQAQAQQAGEALEELEHGPRSEQIAQARANLAAAQAQAANQSATLRRLDVTAPRAGLIDSLPYRLGDEAPVGAPLAVMLVGDRPYARIYVPEPIRANVKVGDTARVFLSGRETALQGRVRMIRSEPSFTPYYALIGEDAARLSYLAEVEITGAPGELPAGVPVRVEFAR